MRTSPSLFPPTSTPVIFAFCIPDASPGPTGASALLLTRSGGPSLQLPPPRPCIPHPVAAVFRLRSFPSPFSPLAAPHCHPDRSVSAFADAQWRDLSSPPTPQRHFERSEKSLCSLFIGCSVFTPSAHPKGERPDPGRTRQNPRRPATSSLPTHAQPRRQLLCPSRAETPHHPPPQLPNHRPPLPQTTRLSLRPLLMTHPPSEIGG